MDRTIWFPNRSRTTNLARASTRYLAVIVAHNRDPDPTFVHANDLACQLWRRTELVGMPSRLTAEPMHRDERAQLLARTQAHGFVDDYRGIRTREAACIDRCCGIFSTAGRAHRTGGHVRSRTWLDEPSLEAGA
ncbi:MAG: MEKHLA domain-containing protein [Pirellulaceae bacterium]